MAHINSLDPAHSIISRQRQRGAAMADESPRPKRPPINLKARIQKYQQATGTESPATGETSDGGDSSVTQSRSFNDLRSMTLTGEDGWVMATNGRSKREVSPLLPPKPPVPPTRKKKYIVEPSEPTIEGSGESSPIYSTIPEKENRQNKSGKLASTDLFLLPAQESLTPPLPARRSFSVKSVPPRPPPPSLKPNRRINPDPDPTVSLTSNTVPSYSTKKPPDLPMDGPVSRDRKSSGADTKSSEETSSLSDSVEESSTPKQQSSK